MKNQTQNSIKQVIEKYTVRTVRGCKESASLSRRRATAWPTSRRGAATTRRGRRRGRKALSSGFHKRVLEFQLENENSVKYWIPVTGIICQSNTFELLLYSSNWKVRLYRLKLQCSMSYSNATTYDENYDN